jgi:hypothetical protein
MKFKLNHSEFIALYTLLTNAVEDVEPSNLAEKLFLSILDNVYGKMYLKARVPQKKYQLKLSTHEAIAFLCYFKNVHFEATSYEGNLVLKICNSIQQKFN